MLSQFNYLQTKILLVPLACSYNALHSDIQIVLHQLAWAIELVFVSRKSSAQRPTRWSQLWPETLQLGMQLQGLSKG